ncbi:MAG: outer membrane protein assembly factor BamD [Pseudomonadota bacterium]
MYRIPVLITSALLVSACATTPDPSGAERDALRTALDRDDCARAGEALGADPDTSDRLEVAHLCLQQGEFAQTRSLAAQQLEGGADAAQADYAAYLHALARMGEWRRIRALPLDRRIDEGRQVFREMAGFLETHAGSRYAESLAPRLASVREDLARLELRQADAAADAGRDDEALERARYVRDYFPGTAAASDASERLASD